MLSRAVIRFLNNEDGATAIEYGLIAAMIAVGLIVAMTTFGNNLTSLFGKVDSRASGAMNAAGS